MLNGYLDNNTYSTPDEPTRYTANGRRILVVDDETGARTALLELLKDEGYEVRGAPDGFKAIGILQQWPCDLLLTDLRMPVMDGLTLLKKVKELRPEMVCIIMTAYGSVENAVEAMKLGADDYLTKPLNFDAVEVVLARAFERMDMMRELDELRRERTVPNPRTRIIGNSPPIQEVNKLIEQIATARATVLITGESGTGKELIARMIHEKSDRANAPFVRLHCAALSETLLESELFGHEKGSFTGATGRRQGRFEEADKGTLFLDEIGEIPMATQVKLLRFLQQREFERVGGNRTITVDVRIVAATNRDLQQAVREGDFREDLYFRLNVIHVKSPPLRTRRSDIPVLVRHFIVKYSEENRKQIKDITAEALDILMAYDWPGNVRELENVIERAVVLTESDIIDVNHLPPDFGQTTLSISHDIRIPGSSLAELERFAILKTYEATGGNTSETADMLGISVRKVQYKLKEYRED
ncbi:MAG: transcriptional regulator [Myxococcales bacterium]|nr:transcriptional regulator [Myxococcales bacterium]